jgi:hypothetical protein
MTRLLGLKTAAQPATARSISASGAKETAGKPATMPAETTTLAMTSLHQKAHDLHRLLDSLEKSIATLTNARDSINEVVGLIEEAGGITIRARDILKTAAGYEGNKDRLAELENRFKTVLTKIDASAAAADMHGVNLLKGGILTTSFGDRTGASDLVTHGYDLTSTGLEFRLPDFSSLFKVQDSRIDVMNSLDIAVTLRHQVTSDIMLIQTRQEFSQNTIETLNAGAGAIRLNDLGEEAANLLALQVRQQLGETDEPLASESQRSLLKQF